MARPTAVVVTLVLAVAGCEPAAPGFGEPPEMDHSKLHPVALTSEVVYDAESLALPKEVEVIGPNLAILDAAADSVVLVIRREDGALVRAFGRRGEGPGEYSGAWSIDAAASNGHAFWVYDFALLRMTRVDVDRARRGERPTDRMVHLASNVIVVDPVWLDDTVVSLGLFDSGRMAQFDADGRFIRTMGTTPPGSEDVPASVRQHAYQSKLKPNPSHTRLAVVTRHADRLEIYQPDGSLVAAPEPLFGFLPKYEVRERRGEPDMATGEDLRFGYIDVTTTDDRIYALFSGRTRRGFPGMANFGEYVHVFDWHGRLVSVLRLDSDAIAISVDPSGRTLYAVRHYPRPAVLRYALPPVREPIRIGMR